MANKSCLRLRPETTEIAPNMVNIPKNVCVYYIYTYIYTCVYVYICGLTNLFNCVSFDTCMYVRYKVHVDIWLYTCLFDFTHIRIYIYIYTYTRTYVYIHI